MFSKQVHASKYIVEYLGQSLINDLCINAAKTAELYSGLLIFPEEVNGKNGFVPWGISTLPVRVLDFRCIDFCSCEYVDAYWNVDCSNEEPEFDAKHEPYIVGVTYCLEDLCSLSSYYTWKLA